jgi:hypothetical protein
MGTTQQENETADLGDYERVVHRRANQRNSNGTIDITLPSDQVEKYGIEDGDQLAIVVCSNGLAIRPSFGDSPRTDEKLFSSGIVSGEDAFDALGGDDE